MATRWSRQGALSRRRTLGLIGGSTAAALLAACASGETKDPSTVGVKATSVPGTVAPNAADADIKKGLLKAAEPNAKRGGNLRVLGAYTVANFDAHQGGGADIMIQMHNRLVRKNPLDGLQTIVPDLAESWETSADGKVYTFKLRQGVTFHDGTPFTADDVAATFNRIVKPPSGLAITVASTISMLDGAEVVDPSTVRMTLKGPRPYFLDVLALPSMLVYSKKHLDQNGGDLRKVVSPGTGPFVYKEYRPGEAWVMTRNPNYWNKQLPYADGLEMIHMAGWPDRGTAIIGGQADYASIVSADMYDEGQKRKDVVGVSRHDGTGASLQFYINNERKPFGDPRVRKAINLGVNRYNLLKAYETSEPIPISSSRWMSDSNQFATPVADIQKLPGYRTSNAQDVADAKKLLEAAGVGSGISDLEIVTGSNPAHVQLLAPAFQQELKRNLNIDAKIRVVEIAARQQEYVAGSFDFLLGVIFQAPVISEPVTAWGNCIRTKAALNYSRYSNPELDKVIDQIETEPDVAKRKALYTKGMDMLDENPPFYVVGFTKHNAMWRNAVKGHAEDQRRYNEGGPVDLLWFDK